MRGDGGVHVGSRVDRSIAARSVTCPLSLTESSVLVTVIVARSVRCSKVSKKGRRTTVLERAHGRQQSRPKWHEFNLRVEIVVVRKTSLLMIPCHHAHIKLSGNRRRTWEGSFLAICRVWHGNRNLELIRAREVRVPITPFYIGFGVAVRRLEKGAESTRYPEEHHEIAS